MRFFVCGMIGRFVLAMNHIAPLLMFIGFVCAQDITIAVLDFDGKGVSQSEASTLTDRFRDELFKVESYSVLERALMENILTEQGFQQSGCGSNECVVDAGNMLGVQQIAGGSVGKVGNVFSVSVRIIDVESGRVLNIANYDHVGELGYLLTNGMKVLANDISGLEPPLEEKEKETLTIESEEVLIEIMQDQEPEVAIESIKGDCYNDGYDSGKFVNRYGALFLGFVGGYKGGPIGWYLVKSIVNASNPQPPDLEINALDGDCKNEYKKGFKNGAINHKKRSVLNGCLIGYLLFLKSRI